MSGLPGGTVTFLFTDIEGSTRLLRRLGERYVEVVGRHDRLVRAACAAHGGREINTQGDAFFVAFERAGDAVAAALRVQRALAAERWPEGASVRVRMGLHTGEPVVGGANYVGLAVHRAARICAVGHGGQILLSSATREVLEDGLRPEISFRDLGEWRLKDFDRAEHLFQVVVGDLPAEFPPPASIAVQPGAADVVGLPPELDAGTPLAGREAELDAMREQWRSAHGGTGRLALVAGLHGMGKTRLAAELAGEVHRDRGAVLYASGAGAPDTALKVLASARAARRPALLVLDDVDRACDVVRAELDELVGALPALPVLVVATAEDADLGFGRRTDETIVLAPLDAAGVRAVVRLYADGCDDAEIPFEQLAETSAGVPLRVHRAAVEWARTRVARRLAETANRIAAERPVLRAAEDDLAGSIVELHSDRGQSEPWSVDGDDVVCPFKGLASFDVADAAFFFGRERLVAEMVARLTGAPLMGIVGPSGSGKSSVLRAGLLAALAAGVLPGSERWALAPLRPGEHPMQALEQATIEVAPRGRLVIAVDQFEEAFTACRDEIERGAFVDALVASARDPRRRAVVLVAVRADFYGRCTAYPELAKLLGANQVLVGPMGSDELRRAIELPARRAGLEIEPELVDALIADVEDEPGALPLLSSALLELWQHRDGRRLGLGAYERTGRVRGSVARLAEEAFGELDPGQQAVTRGLLMRMAGEGAGGSVVRRRVALAELGGRGGDDLARVLAALTERRLVTVSATAVEVAHEALLREWPRLRGWLEEDAEGRRVHRHVADAARDWEARGRDRGDLYRGARLAAALEWRGGHEAELASTERAFLDASRADQQRAQRRLRVVFAGVATLLVLAVAGGVVAVHQRGRARTAATADEAQRLGVQALSEQGLDRSLLLARQGVALDDSRATRSNLLAVLLRSPAAIRVIRGAGPPLSALGVSPDGRTLAMGDNAGNVLLVDPHTGRRVGQPYKAPGPISMLSFSPDGSRLAIAGGSVEVLDARTHRAPLVLNVARVVPLSFEPGPVASVVFSPNSRVLAAEFPIFGRPGEIIVRWDARTGRPVGRPQRIASRPEPALVGFIAHGTRLVTSSAADRATVIRDAFTLRPVRRLRGGGSPAAVSPDGRVAALGAADGSVRLLDLRTGTLRGTTGRHDAPVYDLRFTPDSRTLITGGGDGRVDVWNVKNATRIETFEGHEGPVSRVTVAPDGRTAYSAGQDGTVIAWDLTGTRRLGRTFTTPPLALHITSTGGMFIRALISKQPRTRAATGPPAASSFVVATPDGASFAVADDAGYVDAFDSRTLTRIGRIPVSPGTPLTGIALAPDGRTVAATTRDGHLRFADLRTRRPLGPPHPDHHGAAWSPAFSGDGRWLATAGFGPGLRLWDVRHRRTANASDIPATAVTLGPDGTKLAAPVLGTRGTRRLLILSVPRLTLLTKVSAPADAGSVQFSGDGHTLLFGDSVGRTWLYDTLTWRPQAGPLVGHVGAVVTVNLSPDAQTLATTSNDGTTRLWDVASRRPIGIPLPGIAELPVAAAFVDGGAHLVTVYDNGRGYLWDIRPQSWERRACEVAGGTLTRTEWDGALPNRTYTPACTHS